MHLLFIRHGIAADREDFARTGADDDQRPLTGRGRGRTRRAMRGLATLVDEVDLVATSPLVRARQTAEIVAAELGRPRIAETEVLRPGADPRQLVGWLSARSEGTVALVGHEPHFSSTVSWLLCADPRPAIEVKKASAILLDVAAGEATLVWALPPRALRRLARSGGRSRRKGDSR